MIVEVNGIKYEQINKDSPKMSSRASTFMAMAMMMSGMAYGDNKDDILDGIDIVEEYGLVQQKKSKLSAKQRRVVVNRFERNFKKLTNA